MQSGGSRKKMIADTCMQIDTGHRKGSSKNEPSELSEILKLLAMKRCIQMYSLQGFLTRQVGCWECAAH